MLNQLRLIISIAYGEQVLTAVAHKPEFRGGNPVFEVMSRVSQSGVAKTPWSTPRYRPRGFHFSARTHLFINSIMARQWLFSVRSWWTRQTGFYPHPSPSRPKPACGNRFNRGLRLSFFVTIDLRSDTLLAVGLGRSPFVLQNQLPFPKFKLGLFRKFVDY